MSIKLSDPTVEPARPFHHGHVYEVQQTTGPARLMIGPRGDAVELMLNVADSWEHTELAVLYVLLVSRRGTREPGRYESPRPLSFPQVAAFCRRFKALFEQDGRHHLWIQSRFGPLLVYDRHEWIYAYGDLPRYTAILEHEGLVPGDFRLPVPHAHHYNAEFDSEENALMEYWNWTHRPLAPSDDD